MFYHCLFYSDKNSKRARDVMLLKKLKTSLREEGGLYEVISICKELQTNEMKLQGLDLLCSSRYISPDLLYDVINIFTPTLEAASSIGNE